MERNRLSAEEVASELASLNGWEYDDDQITRKFKFANFAQSLEFVNKVGSVAEASDHHPDITFGWGYAELTLTTHDRGGVTAVDLALAKKIDEL